MTDHGFHLLCLPHRLAVCRLAADAPIPEWVDLSPAALCSITRTADELSIVCAEDAVPDGVQCERGWRALRVAGVLDFSTVGVLASLATPLAEAGVSIFVVSTFDTDYLLVKEIDLNKATAALEAADHTVSADD